MLSLTNLLSTKNAEIPAITQPYIIAEAGVNHEGSLDLAKRLIHEAKEGGAHAIKFQTYKAETLAAKDSPSYWDTSLEKTKSQYQLFKKYDKFWKNEFEKLKHECDKYQIEFLSTPFDTESAQFLNDLMPAFKISSSDLNNLPFIEYLTQFRKPIILSTGAAYLWEIQKTVSFIQEKGNPLALLHCVLNYPTADENANLGMILGLKKAFPDLIIGYSDHTLPKQMDVLITATLLGAHIIEKHFTHDKKLPGNDHYHAMNKEDLLFFWQKLDKIMPTIGSFEVTSLPGEEISRKNARRSLVATQNIKKNTIISPQHLTWKRPATGISPSSIKKLIGMKAQIDISEDTILQWNMFTN